MVSGAAIALANAAAGAERDAAAGIPTPAVRLGRRTTNVVISALLAIVAAIAIITIVGFRPGQLATLTATLGLVLLGVGVLMVWRPPRRVEIAWELCAAGLAVLGIAWLAAAGQR
jgi:4-hydroxybenzoate polyprenyltransferase